MLAFRFESSYCKRLDPRSKSMPLKLFQILYLDLTLSHAESIPDGLKSLDNTREIISNRHYCRWSCVKWCASKGAHEKNFCSSCWECVESQIWFSSIKLAILYKHALVAYICAFINININVCICLFYVCLCVCIYIYIYIRVFNRYFSIL